MLAGVGSEWLLQFGCFLELLVPCFSLATSYFSCICVWVHLILNGFSQQGAAQQVGGLISWVILSCSRSNPADDLADTVALGYINHWRWNTLTNHHNLTQSFRGRPLVGGSVHRSKCAAEERGGVGFIMHFQYCSLWMLRDACVLQKLIWTWTKNYGDYGNI